MWMQNYDPGKVITADENDNFKLTHFKGELHIFYLFIYLL